MARKKGNNGSRYAFEPSYDGNSFISDVIQTFNDISDAELETQKTAIRNVMEHIRRACAEGLTYEEIDDRLLYNMSNLFTIIKYPNLTNFYQLRTLEYMMDTDITPYVEELLKQGFDMHKYQTELKDTYSANVEKNVILEIYGMLSDFIESGRAPINLEFHILAEKAKNSRLTIDDKDVFVKFLKLYLKELEIGKATFWEKQRRDLEACRKLLIKYKDQIFDVKKFDFSAHVIGKKSEDAAIESDEQDDRDLETKVREFKANVDSRTITETIATMSTRSNDRPVNQVTLKSFPKTPFISKDEEQSFLVIMNEALNKFSEKQLTQFYEVLMASENSPSERGREHAKEIVCNFLASIRFQKNLLHAREHLMERLAALMMFYKSSGCLGTYCGVNNTRLNKMYLGDIQIDEDALFSKFISDSSNGNNYFLDARINYEGASKETPLSFTSDEAIIGMSAFYSNRMTKQAQTYAMLPYIVDKLCIIERIAEDPEITYEDLECEDDDIRMYMAMYKCFQKLMVKNFFKNVSPTEVLVEEEVHEKLSRALQPYKRAYEKTYPELGLSFERDIDYVMMDAQLIEEIYAVKDFSVKSLLYTAITDKKKNIINWGYVPEDDNTDGRFVLLGFDIKTLNTPLFVHMKKSELIKFITELTGDTKIRVYEGVENMYRHGASQGWQRVTTQVLYPLSKDERKTLSKVSGTGALMDYYAHIRWLQQPSNPPSFRHKPGTRIYDLKTKVISEIKPVDAPGPGGKKGGQNGGKKGNNRSDR